MTTSSLGVQISVSVVEDHPLYRDALSRVLSDPPAMVVLQAVRTLRALSLPPDRDSVVVLDYHLPEVSGAEAVRAVVGKGHRVLVVSAATDAATLNSAMTAGAHGYVPKSSEAEQLRWAVRSVARGSIYVAPSMAPLLTGAGSSRPAADVLTAREKQVLRHLADGDTDMQIAGELEIGVRAVRSHLDRIRTKTGHRRRPDLTRYAMTEGLLG